MKLKSDKEDNFKYGVTTIKLHLTTYRTSNGKWLRLSYQKCIEEKEGCTLKIC